MTTSEGKRDEGMERGSEGGRKEEIDVETDRVCVERDKERKGSERKGRER